jgi:hypothetical protein
VNGQWPPEFVECSNYMRRLLPLLLIIIVLIISGCRPTGGETPEATQVEAVESANPQATEEAVEVPGTQEPYPYPAPPTYIPATPRSYPAPENVTIIPPTPFTVPEPGSDTGVVTGILVDVETGEPMAFQSVYLGFKIFLTPGPGYSYGLQETTSPHSLTTPDGEFAIADVPPGEYIVMIFTPFGASVIMQPNSDRELEVVVVAGEVVDLGSLEALQPELR